MEDDAGVGAEFPVDLSGAGIDSVDAEGAVLEETIGEAAGGSADVETDFAGGIDMEVGESGFEFEAAAADVFEGFGDFDARGFGDGVAGFMGFLAVHGDFAGEDEGLGFFAGIDELAVEHGDVEALFHDARFCVGR